MRESELMEALLLKMFGCTPYSSTDGYKEIFKLKEMLEEAEIPFTFNENPMMAGYQIVYNGKAEPTDRPCRDTVCDAIEHSGSYGHEKDLLEISGLMTDEEYKETHDTVLGYLTAENVFNRIKKHWDSIN